MTTKTCRHGPCSCDAKSELDGFCSEACSNAGEKLIPIDPTCSCGHATCGESGSDVPNRAPPGLP